MEFGLCSHSTVQDWVWSTFKIHFMLSMIQLTISQSSDTGILHDEREKRVEWSIGSKGVTRQAEFENSTTDWQCATRRKSEKSGAVVWTSGKVVQKSCKNRAIVVPLDFQARACDMAASQSSNSQVGVKRLFQYCSTSKWRLNGSNSAAVPVLLWLCCFGKSNVDLEVHDTTKR